jgi:hypothetical protein
MSFMWLAVFAAVAGILADQVDAAGTASDGPEVRTVAWSFLALQAERMGNRVDAEVWITALPAAGEQALFLPSPKGAPFCPHGQEVLKLSIRFRIHLMGRSPVRIENHVWFDPKDGTPLYLIRTRSGLDDYYQQFRFTQEGVFRRQREPASAVEALRPVETWTKVGEHFYAHPPNAENCHPILETSTLIYLLCDAAGYDPRSRSSLCVFHKRQLHRVSLQTETTETVDFDFLEKRGGGEARRSGKGPANRIQIESRPIGSYRGEVEDFLRDGTLLYLSPDGRLPLMASCELPLIGRVEMKLKEIHLK